ncbi:MAG: prepilin-type N-terminal cleavage/methylation domain-containing protein, partial [Armatimonadia bacterium]|nr:prepilin-type N-terminal cleavage/methylation domain-containing protein [Armatimonadia bacterium]
MAGTTIERCFRPEEGVRAMRVILPRGHNPRGMSLVEILVTIFVLA